MPAVKTDLDSLFRPDFLQVIFQGSDEFTTSGVTTEFPEKSTAQFFISHIIHFGSQCFRCVIAPPFIATKPIGGSCYNSSCRATVFQYFIVINTCFILAIGCTCSTAPWLALVNTRPTTTVKTYT